jgi:Na+/melibiose symporter-like transporter
MIETEQRMPTFSVVQILTASIAPVIVISGVGLLLLSISNRYGRAIDRVRLLAREMSESDPESAGRRHLTEQLRLTNDRAHILKRSMLYASVCIFFVSLTIISLFAEQLLGLQKDFVALPFFALCLLSLVVSMYFSIRDITVSLAALELEVSERMRGDLHLP